MAISHQSLLRGVVLTVMLSPGLTAADETRRYDWLTSGRVTGFHVITIKDDGSRVADFEFNDRGRGPKLHELIKFDREGRVSRLEITGHAYMGADVKETFQRQGSTAQWRSTLEQGASEHATDAFYLASDGTPEQSALLARTLLAAPDQSLEMLPGGNARIEKLDSARTGPPGEEMDVDLYVISGLDLTPSYIWLDQDLELFGNAAAWMGLVPEGWAEHLPPLLEKQKAAEAQYFRDLTARLTRKLPDEYVIENAKVVDVEAGEILEDRLVVVRNGQIATLGHKLPEDFQGETLEAGGAYLAPGLWDMHTHMGMEGGLQHVAGGVTTVRDLGNNPHQLLPLREQFRSGEIIGPRIIAAGIVEGKSQYSAPLEKLSETEEDATAIVREYAAMGYAQIKVYSSADPAWIPAVADQAHSLGLRLSGHIPNGMTAEQAILAGYDEIQHINMLFLNFLAGPEVDTRTPQRFTLIAEKAAELDLDSPTVRKFLKLMQDRETVVDPTVAIFIDMLTHVPGEVGPNFAMVADHFPPRLRRSQLSSRLVNSVEEAQANADDAQALLDMISAMHQRGIRIVAGTDGLPGFLLHRELELYVQAGMTPAEALRLATLGAAEVMGLEGESGSIEPGKRADFMLLEANPLEDISALRRARLVIIGQNAWKPAHLHQAMGIRPFVTD